jgi:hypothetical protein
MSVYSAEYHAMVHSPDSAVEQVTVSGSRAQPDGEGFLHHLLDVINPLQHLPVVGTLYRAITGEHIGPVEKVMGDTLYGGMWGAITSVADVAFEGLTGKSVEDTVIGWLHHDSGSGIAARKVNAPQIAMNASPPSVEMPALSANQTASAPDGLELVAFDHALSAKGVNGELAQRAMYAYRRSMGLPAQPVLSSLN